MVPDNSKDTDISTQEISILSTALNKSVDQVKRWRHIVLALVAGILLGAFITVAVIEFKGPPADIQVSGIDTLLHKTDETILNVKVIKNGVDRLSEDVQTLATQVRTNALTPPKPDVAKAAVMEEVVTGTDNKAPEEATRPMTNGTKQSCVERKKATVDRGRFTVYIHYRGREHRRTAAQLAGFLQKQNYNVPEAERVQDKKNDIRYFHAADEEGALALQNDLDEFFAQKPGVAAIDLELLDLSRVYPQASQGLLEIWINF